MQINTKAWMSACAVATLLIGGAGSASAQYAGSNVTGTTGLIAIDKVGNKIRFYDPVTLGETKVVEPPGNSVHEMTVSYDHKWAFTPLYGDGTYASNPEPNNKILVIDLTSQSISRVIDLGGAFAPHGMAATRDGKLWVTCDRSKKLLLVDPVRGVIEASYDNPATGGHFMALLPDETKLYISNKEGPISVFDLRRRIFLPSIAVGRAGVAAGNGSGSEGITMRPDGKQFIVIDNDRSDMRVIDTATDKEIDRVAFEGAPMTNPRRSRLMKLQYSPDARYIVATTSAGAEAWVIDGRDLRRQTRFAVAKGPQGMAFAPDGRTALVSSHDSGLLTQVDLASGRPIKAVDGGDGIEVLAYY